MGKAIMMMMMMIKCFCGMAYRRKALSIISRQNHCQRFSPSLIADTPQVGVEPAQKLNSGFFERSCAMVTTTTPRSHYFRYLNQAFFEWKLKKRMNISFFSWINAPKLTKIKNKDLINSKENIISKWIIILIKKKTISLAIKTIIMRINGQRKRIV